jgi:curved DNA-binding protein CbpA
MSERYEGQTYYELLEVTPQAGPTDIYNAYQRARSTYSPSSPALYSMFTPQEAQELMALIEEAYQTLSHQGKRREYDLKLGLIDPRMKPDKPFISLKHEKSTKKVDDPWVGPVKVVHRSKEELPKGFARTKFSTYEVKPDMEAELAQVQECDGAYLKKIRLYKGVSVEQMSEEIRVVKSTLNALEANDLDPLPVAVFTRGFVVQYARALNLDEKKISDAYMKFFKARKVVR